MSGRLPKEHKDRGGVRRDGAITFARAAARPFAVAVAVMLALALAACAAVPRPSPTVALPETPGRPTGPAFGTVAAVRPITDAAGNGPEARILTAMGVAAPGGAVGAEIVVQTDDGQTLSVVQANAAGLAPGARVEIVPGAMPRLAPLAAAAPAS
jgi:outer membrane lipoprotein SlyB